ncbi:hypothetical protein C8Q74DRAFT_1294605 [Fomes fomentarius]|nr:hypothetical protein C8Q74DRAFT_1294605 [Fomes fomentarius]
MSVEDTSMGATQDMNPTVAAPFFSGGFSNVFPRPYQSDSVEKLDYAERLRLLFLGKLKDVIAPQWRRFVAHLREERGKRDRREISRSCDVLHRFWKPSGTTGGALDERSM